MENERGGSVFVEGWVDKKDGARSREMRVWGEGGKSRPKQARWSVWSVELGSVVKQSIASHTLRVHLHSDPHSLSKRQPSTVELRSHQGEYMLYSILLGQ